MKLIVYLIWIVSEVFRIARNMFTSLFLILDLLIYLSYNAGVLALFVPIRIFEALQTIIRTLRNYRSSGYSVTS